MKHDTLHFCILENQLERFDETNKTILGYFKIETPITVDIDDFAALRAKTYASTCKKEELNKRKLKGNTKVALQVEISRNKQNV